MVFKPGQTGNPGGRGTEKEWRDALRLAIARATQGDKRGINRLADKLVEMALAGDGWALGEIGNRLDGKSHQQLPPKDDLEDAKKTGLNVTINV